MTLRDGWSDQALAWAEWARTPEHDVFFWWFNLPEFLDLLPEPVGLTLDIGCGEGRLARELAARGYDVIGVDATEMLASLALQHDPPLVTSVGDAAALPFRDECASLAVAFMSFQDIDELERSVLEAARVLAPGGRLCMAIIHPIDSAGAFADRSDPDSPFTISGSYMDRTRLVEPFEYEGLSMVFHSEHRPLSDYFAALETAGFVVEALREPVPDERLARANPRLRRQQRIPTFLHLRARRER